MLTIQLQAIAVSPNIEYCVIRWQDEHYLVAVDRVDFLMQKLQDDPSSKTQILTSINGALLEHTVCLHPFLPRESPILLGSHVTTSAGTGLVHTAPGKIRI